MKRLLTFFLISLSSVLLVRAQLKTPDDFLGYELGSHFTPHHKVADYFRQTVAASPKNTKLIEYGKTNEGRPLLVAIVSTPENINRLEQIRNNNLKLTAGTNNNVDLSSQPAILWLSYNVHGNEASSTETSMKMLYTLVSGTNKPATEWLKNTVVVIDPCLNPDGRDRYVNYFNSVVGKTPNSDPASREHIEPWPGGRPNHYYFDLNRDWAWQTQIESQQRLALYNQWMPQVHVDFHEQSYNEPYYFAPAAEPVHQDITPWQKSFQVVVGKNNAKYFDAEGWQYFTKERFDLLYPSYGDTYPLYNGSIGMTYEQGGIRAGLSVVTNDGDTLTLKDRIAHHFTTGMSTVEVTALNHNKLLEEYKQYFQQGLVNAPGIYKSYIIKAGNLSRLNKLAELLTKNKIEFAFGGDKQGRAFDYDTQKEENFTLGRNDLVVNVQQSRAVLANVLLEPHTFVTDSNTYDITAWALPYVFGLKAYASKESIKGKFSAPEETKIASNELDKPLAWLFSWGTSEDAQVLIALQKANIKVRQADQPFSVNGKDYPAGTLIVLRAENERITKGLKDKVTLVAKTLDKPILAVSSGFVEKGKDFGSNVYPLLKQPKIAIVSGMEVSSLAFGEVWFYIEHDLNLSPSIINAKDINSLDINKVNTLILPDGSYDSFIGDGLTAWLDKGGKLILMEDAIESFLDKKGFDIKKKEVGVKKDEKQEANKLLFKDKDRDDFETTIPGAVYKINLDASHPFSYGLGRSYYSLKTDRKIYEPFVKGWNVGLVNEKSLMAGVVGKKAKEELKSGLLIGVQDFGRGQVVYLANDPLFRNFWEGGKTLFGNVIFCSY
ncbi:zinc carboxypeptidase [Pedobacter sp. HDW13]|uniref:M14 family metallopeptidase n=1 Tax=unclassified Pedobacter TaxID=2628915 RepID=UPI000F5B60F2|nr:MULTISPECIES: M14 family metallopeptidase [unclassified Pedobacter]QIL39421.1 zinc carboxypeptidase [Pedobacter sp. HDW13]RQO71069.1 zinc carboxypeptidase [Pedobacter sp. KBW01]